MGWWSVLVCFMAIIPAAPLVAGERTSEKISSDPKVQPMSLSFTSSFNRGMDPFWYGCQDILLDTEPFESWFDDAKTNTAVIDVMIDAVPFSYDADKSGDANVLN